MSTIVSSQLFALQASHRPPSTLKLLFVLLPIASFALPVKLHNETCSHFDMKTVNKNMLYAVCATLLNQVRPEQPTTLHGSPITQEPCAYSFGMDFALVFGK